MSDVVRRQLIVIDPLGLHARAAAAVVAALGPIAGVVIRAGERAVPATSVLALMGLGIEAGDVIVIEGPVEAEGAIAEALATISAVAQPVVEGPSDDEGHQGQSSSS
ncbi:Phosphotransferase system, phosphocarrier protein HPr [Acidimicrobium ferrooxidans DSM 10331]|uniref:Phosphocarrier protein HPr n=1 Tax=Acidimicrobium ferrooxidans (strain DSM 10331 / JCM 15462 / NBRC 103882 / ICP) TaxID=525909 RepID=C7LYM1_ACIFD|nr:HPr family phosphocarrier protein [Acidimicrobium ferrooxidans]ACU53829.1 Phosphotransferase system, phosphocarrier protein HPr [Acidimicrobium ferrooxidans DSM 10331]